ncbi:carbohydrate ABC transporter permease [Kineosporia babensis]|uniref:Sugar ABC transporter permease n=1 Tax=Kineosporia babensis TaxID=499548 RepID=A0A9X1NIC5_9ACTN|nr:sugar ABC transporter permease [Kineosporia babensis]MCD5314600.1 sugar ABC transporter permease [Kineosporia babensis]
MSIVSEPIAENAARGRKNRRKRSGRNGGLHSGDGRMALYLLGPTMIMLALIVGYPVLNAIYKSFLTDPGLDDSTGLFNEGNDWNGTANYAHWILQRCNAVGGGTESCPAGNLGSQFWDSVWVTLGFTVVTVIIEVIIGMLFALMMHQAFRGRSLVRVAVLIPWAVPTAVIAKLWVVIFDPQGVLNNVLGTSFAWTSEAGPARMAIVIADVWKTTPFIALLILAGLQGISSEVYESAKVDGANAWQRFWRITLPLVKPALAVAVIFRALDVLRMYDLPWVLTQGSNGTQTISILVVKELASKLNSAAALSTITFVLIFAIALALVRLFNANIVDRGTR